MNFMVPRTAFLLQVQRGSSAHTRAACVISKSHFGRPASASHFMRQEPEVWHWFKFISVRWLLHFTTHRPWLPGIIFNFESWSLARLVRLCAEALWSIVVLLPNLAIDLIRRSRRQLYWAQKWMGGRLNYSLGCENLAIFLNPVARTANS